MERDLWQRITPRRLRWPLLAAALVLTVAGLGSAVAVSQRSAGHDQSLCDSLALAVDSGVAVQGWPAEEQDAARRWAEAGCSGPAPSGHLAGGLQRDYAAAMTGLAALCGRTDIDAGDFEIPVSHPDGSQSIVGIAVAQAPAEVTSADPNGHRALQAAVDEYCNQ